MNDFLTDLRARAIDGGARRIILPEAGDERVCDAAKKLAGDGLAEPIMVCRSEDISHVRALGLPFVEIQEDKALALEKLLLELRASKAGTKDELSGEMATRLARDPLFYGAYLLRLGEGDGLVAGASRTTAEVIRAGLWLVGKAEGIRTVSSSFYIIVPAFRGAAADEILTFSDCAVVPEPSAEQLADIAIAAADARSRIVGDEPRIALLSYSTHGSGAGRTVELVREATTLVKTRRPDLSVDGEMQADAALIASIAKRKSADSAVGGHANVLVFPSLDAGNIAYKLVHSLTPGAEALGPVLQGMKKPMSDLSRGATVDDIVRIVTIVASQVPPRRA